MIFPEGALEEAELGLERQGGVFVHAIGGLGGLGLAGQVLDGIVDIPEHVLEHGFTGVAGIVQIFIGRPYLVVDPRHVAKLAHHVGIIVGAPEMHQGGVFRHGLGVRALVHIGQQGVHLPEVGERPAAARGRHGAVIAAAEEVGRIHFHQQIVFPGEGFLVQQVVIEGIGEELQVFGRPEIRVRRELGLGIQRQQIIEIAGNCSKGSQRKI